MTASAKKRRSERWLARLGWAALGLVVVAGLLVLGLEVAVRQPWVQDAVKQRVEREVEERTGFGLTLRSLRASLIRGSLGLQGVAVGVPGADPVLEVEAIEVAWRWTSLLGGPLTLERLHITRPEVDLGAPRPAAAAATADGDGDFILLIEKLRVSDGRIDGPVVPPELASWIDDWWMQDLSLQGRYGPDLLEVALRSLGRWSRVDDVEGELTLRAHLVGPVPGPWEIEDVSLSGDGIAGQLSGTLGVDPEHPIEGSYQLELEPHLLVPVPPAAEPIRLAGDFDLRRGTETVDLQARGLPIELTFPWLTDELAANELLADWRIDLGADLAVRGPAIGPEGGIELGVTRNDERWLTGSIDLPAAAGSSPASLAVEARLLPDLRGSRALKGVAEAPGWDRLDQLRLSDSAIELVRTDLADIAAALASIWPEPLPEGMESALRGRIDATATVSGAIAALQAEVGGRWADEEVGWVDLRASGSAERVVVESVEGVIAERRFTGRGAVDLPTPIASAEVHLEMEQPIPELQHVAVDARLANGSVTLMIQPRTANGVTSEVRAALPLATLARMPELGAAVRDLPLVQASGPLELEWRVPQADWDGLLASVGEELPISRLHFGAMGSMTLDPARPLAGQGELVVSGLELVSGDLKVAGEGPIAMRLAGGELILEMMRLATPGGVLELEAWSDLDADWQLGAPIDEVLERYRVEANGVAPVALLATVVDDLQTDGDLQVGLSLDGTLESLTGEVRLVGREVSLVLGGDPGIEITDPVIDVAFADQAIEVRQASAVVEGGQVTLSGEATLPTLVALMGAEETEPPPLAPIEVRLEVAASDWTETLGKLGIENIPDGVRIGGQAAVSVDPSRPLEAQGWVELDPVTVVAGDHRIDNQGSIRLELAEGEIELSRFELTADGQPFTLTGSMTLDRDWSAEEPPTALVEGFDFAGQGTLAAVLLNPFLAGGSADGLVEVTLEASGTLEEPTGRIRIDGPTASVVYLTPYVARIEAPELDIELVDGRAHIRDGRIRLNDGDVELGGSVGLDGAELTADFDGLRFRLDYGLLVKVDGDLDLTLDPEGRGRLAGEIIVDQGSLTRQISIDRDFITNLLTPLDLTGSEASLLEQIALDLRLETRRGVRVRNNVADLAVGWNNVHIGGTLAEPVVDGRFVIEPGGRAFLFGQTLRIDSGVVTFPGQPGAEAILDLETTSSFDDPSIGRLAGDDALSLGELDSEMSLQVRAEGAAAAFVGEQLETRLGAIAPGARLTFRPILIFGEADPGARLTVGRDFSHYVTLAASIDLRNAQSQTYLMEAHSIPKLPGLTVQVFTSYRWDETSSVYRYYEGATLQHRLRFGGYRRTAPTGPNLRRLEIDAVPGVKPRALRRSVGLSKGDRASNDDLFLAEVEIGEFLRRQGYPDAEVEVRSSPVPEQPKKVDVAVTIDPGPRARFSFAGEELSRPLQRSITALYRSDFYEAQSLAEMEAQTVRALRSLGHLNPTAQVVVEKAFDENGREERHVTIQMQGGASTKLEDLRVVGLPEAEAQEAAASFATRVQLVELAVAEPAADRRLLSNLRSLGYPEPEIVGRAPSADGRTLEVEVDPGAQRRLVTVTVDGVEPEWAEQLVAVSGVEAGDAARRDVIASGAVTIERELQSRGYAKARVRPRIESPEAGGDGPVELVFEVEPGIAYEVADSEVTGVRSTSKRWATNVAEMESGAPLREDEVYAARSRLYDTGLFTMVNAETIETGAGRSEVVFNVEERPRFSVAYGARWDSDEGTQAVVDVIDQNFLGRGVTLGLRGLYKQDDWSVRLGAGVPRLFGSRATLEMFGSYRDRFDESTSYDEATDTTTRTTFDEQNVESSIQLAYPFGAAITGRIYGRYRTDDLVITDSEEHPIFPIEIVTVFSFNRPLIGTLWIYDTRGRELVLNDGIFGSVDLSGTGEFLNSDFEYVRLFSQLNLYRRVGRWAGRRLSWAQSLRLGLADSFDQELDRKERFFAGGQYSVRGYPTDSLGPVEQLGDDLFRPLGGKTLVVINEEVRFDLWGPLAGLAFLDLGNVWEDTAEFSSSLFKSLGVGLRADTPVGLLRLDYAIPLDRREDDPSYQLYFGFGNTF